MSRRMALLLLLISLCIGIFSVVVNQKQKYPAVDLSYSSITIAFPGATVEEVEQLIAIPAEQILSEVEGIEHIFSTSRPGQATVTVQYKPGTDKTQATMRLYDVMFSSQNWLPSNIGIESPIIKPIGIDDIPMMTLTLWSEKDNTAAFELQQVAHSLETELMRVHGVRNIETLGGAERVVRVIIDPVKAASFSIGVNEIMKAVNSANVSYNAGKLVRDNQAVPVQAGGFLTSTSELEDLVIGVMDGSPVYLSDVTNIIDGPDIPRSYVTHFRSHHDENKKLDKLLSYPAVTMLVTYKPDANEVIVANKLLQHLQGLKGSFIPDEVNVEVTRNYSQSMHGRIHALLFKTVLVLSLLCILVSWYKGIQVGLYVAFIATVSLMWTLFVAWLYGIAISQISLSAIILLIGFLVIEAVAVVTHVLVPGLLEKVSKHLLFNDSVMQMGAILLCFSLLPTLFIPGLAGSFLKPFLLIFIFGAVISLVVGYMFMLFLSVMQIRPSVAAQTHSFIINVRGWIVDFVETLLTGPFCSRHRYKLWFAVALLFVFSLALVYFKWAVVRVLPYDDSMEFQIMVDMPDGTALEKTQKVLNEIAYELNQIPSISHFQTYAGIAPPLTLSSLVRQDHQRDNPGHGSVHVNLVERSSRNSDSHEIVRNVRDELQHIASRYGAAFRFVEVSAGLPSYAPIVAEIYGADTEQKSKLASRIRDYMTVTDSIVDIESSVEAASLRYVIQIDRQRAAGTGISQYDIAHSISIALNGEDISFLHDTNTRHPVPIRLELPVKHRAALDSVLNMKLRSPSDDMVSIRDLTNVVDASQEKIIYHKDLLPVVYVTADMAGRIDSPAYGMFSIARSIHDDQDLSRVEQYLFGPPSDPYRSSIQWAGEWQITYQVFSGIILAWAAGLILIYLFLTIWLRSYVLSLIVFAPVPFMITGVFPGHVLFEQQFSVMSMLGMVLISGLTIRNTGTVIYGVQQLINRGQSVEGALLETLNEKAGFIVFSGLAIILEAIFFLGDAVLGGLAVSLICGIFITTIMTLVVVPVVYYIWMRMQAPVPVS